MATSPMKKACGGNWTKRSASTRAYTDRCVGLINDDETEVGKVHLGVVHVFDVETPDVLPRETEIIDAGFRPVAELLADLEGFESWSRICLQALFGEQRPSTAAPVRIED